MKTESFAPRIESIHKIQEFVAGFLSANHIDSEKLMTIELIIEEIVTNITHYGFEEKSTGVIDVGVDIRGQDIFIEISDNGMAFNPLENKDPDVDADLDEREIGGLGIFFVKQLARGARYSRREGKNILALIL